ncbi:MAG: PAS domain-containing protein [Candidatus Omnitrophota bacterium]
MYLRRPFRMLVAICTSVTFLATSVGVSPGAFAAPAMPEVSLPYQAAIDRDLRLAIPHELGKLEQYHAGAGDQPVVFHIQTAHGHYEAQQQVRKILHYLDKQYGVRTVLVEGSAFQLDPKLLNFFPKDAALTQKVNEELTKRALVKGPELYLLDKLQEGGGRKAEGAKQQDIGGRIAEGGKAKTPSTILHPFHEPAVQALGIESLEAYRENGLAFVNVLDQKEKTAKFLADMDMQIDRLAGRFLNKDLRDFLRRVEGFEANKVPLDIWLQDLKKEAQKRLEIDLASPAQQLDWPMMVRFFKMQELAAKFDNRKFPEERKNFLNALRRFLPDGEKPETPSTIHHPISLYGNIERFLTSEEMSRDLPDPETEQLFEDMVKQLPENFNYDAFPNVRFYIGTLLLQSELKADRLFSETKALSAVISGKLTRNQGEKQLVALLADHRLLQKLFALQLMPEDYEAIVGGRKAEGGGSLKPSEIVKRFENAILHPSSPPQIVGRIRPSADSIRKVRSVQFSHIEELDALFEKAMKFYAGVKERDGAMEQRIEERLRETGASKVAVITGGFHSRPFADYFSSKNHTYALISPKLNSSDDAGHAAYEQNMIRFSGNGERGTGEALSWNVERGAWSAKDATREFEFLSDPKVLAGAYAINAAVMRSEVRNVIQAVAGSAALEVISSLTETHSNLVGPSTSRPTSEEIRRSEARDLAPFIAMPEFFRLAVKASAHGAFSLLAQIAKDFAGSIYRSMHGFFVVKARSSKPVVRRIAAEVLNVMKQPDSRSNAPESFLLTMGKTYKARSFNGFWELAEEVAADPGQFVRDRAIFGLIHGFFAITATANNADVQSASDKVLALLREASAESSSQPTSEEIRRSEMRLDPDEQSVSPEPVKGGVRRVGMLEFPPPKTVEGIFKWAKDGDREALVILALIAKHYSGSITPDMKQYFVVATSATEKKARNIFRQSLKALGMSRKNDTVTDDFLQLVGKIFEGRTFHGFWRLRKEVLDNPERFVQDPAVYELVHHFLTSTVLDENTVISGVSAELLTILEAAAERAAQKSTVEVRSETRTAARWVRRGVVFVVLAALLGLAACALPPSQAPPSVYTPPRAIILPTPKIVKPKDIDPPKFQAPAPKIPFTAPKIPSFPRRSEMRFGVKAADIVWGGVITLVTGVLLFSLNPLAQSPNQNVLGSDRTKAEKILQVTKNASDGQRHKAAIAALEAGKKGQPVTVLWSPDGAVIWRGTQPAKLESVTGTVQESMGRILLTTTDGRHFTIPLSSVWAIWFPELSSAKTKRSEVREATTGERGTGNANVNRSARDVPRGEAAESAVSRQSSVVPTEAARSEVRDMGEWITNVFKVIRVVAVLIALAGFLGPIMDRDMFAWIFPSLGDMNPMTARNVFVASIALSFGLGACWIVGAIKKAQERVKHAAMEKVLADNEAMHRQRAALSPAGIFEIALSGEIEYANDMALRIFGYTQEDYNKRMNVLELVVPEDRDRAQRRLKEILEDGENGGAPAAGEYTALRKDGTRFPVLIKTKVRFKGGKPVGFSGAISDITDRKRVEEELRNSQKRLENALKSAGMGTWNWNIKKDRRHYHPQTYHLLGIDPKQPDGTSAESFLKVVHPEDVEKVREAFRRTARENVPYEVEFQVIWPDSSIHHLAVRGDLIRDAQGQPARLDGTVWDVTREKIFEEELQRSHARLSDFERHAPGALYQFQMSPDGQFSLPYGGSSFDRSFGMDPMTLDEDASALFEAIHPEDRSSVIDSIKESANSMRLWSHEFRVVLPNGEVQWRHGSSSPRKLPDGSILWNGFVTDVTDRKRAEEELKENQKLMAHQEHLAALGELLAAVAHELNNPLATLEGLGVRVAQFFAKGDTTHAAESFSAIQDVILHLKKTLKDFLLSVRAEKSSEGMSVFPIARAIEKAVEFNSLAITSSQVVAHQRVDDSLRVYANESKMIRVFSNLIKNAIDAPNGMGDKQITITAEKSADQVGKKFIKIKVRDNGIGAESSEGWFLPFRTSKSERNGNGLGLTIVKTLITEIGGSVTARTAVGKGTVIEIVVPQLTQLEMDSLEKKEVSTPKTITGGEVRNIHKILVAEDDRLIRGLIEGFLRDAGYEVFVAKNGQEALDLLSDEAHQAQRFDLILSDYGMPVMNGAAFARAFRVWERQKRPKSEKIPLILVTSYGTGSQYDESQQLISQGVIDRVEFKEVTPGFLNNLLDQAKRMPLAEISEDVFREIEQSGEKGSSGGAASTGKDPDLTQHPIDLMGHDLRHDVNNALAVFGYLYVFDFSVFAEEQRLVAGWREKLNKAAQAGKDLCLVSRDSVSSESAADVYLPRVIDHYAGILALAQNIVDTLGPLSVNDKSRGYIKEMSVANERLKNMLEPFLSSARERYAAWTASQSAAPALASESTSSVMAPDSASSDVIRILFADRDDTIRSMFVTFMDIVNGDSSWKLEIETVESGEKALEVIKGKGVAYYDGVILDDNVAAEGQISGREAGNTLSTQWGYQGSLILASGNKYGRGDPVFSRVVDKPFSPDELRQWILDPLVAQKERQLVAAQSRSESRSRLRTESGEATVRAEVRQTTGLRIWVRQVAAHGSWFLGGPFLAILLRLGSHGVRNILLEMTYSPSAWLKRRAANALSRNPSSLIPLIDEQGTEDRIFDAASSLILSGDVSGSAALIHVLSALRSRDVRYLPRLSAVLPNVWSRVPEANVDLWTHVVEMLLTIQRNEFTTRMDLDSVGARIALLEDAAQQLSDREAQIQRSEMRSDPTEDFRPKPAAKAEGASSESVVSSLPSVVSGEAARTADSFTVASAEISQLKEVLALHNEKWAANKNKYMVFSERVMRNLIRKGRVYLLRDKEGDQTVRGVLLIHPMKTGGDLEVIRKVPLWKNMMAGRTSEGPQDTVFFWGISVADSRAVPGVNAGQIFAKLAVRHFLKDFTYVRTFSPILWKEYDSFEKKLVGEGWTSAAIRKYGIYLYLASPPTEGPSTYVDHIQRNSFVTPEVFFKSTGRKFRDPAQNFHVGRNGAKIIGVLPQKRGFARPDGPFTAIYGYGPSESDENFKQLSGIPLPGSIYRSLENGNGSRSRKKTMIQKMRKAILQLSAYGVGYLGLHGLRILGGFGGERAQRRLLQWTYSPSPSLSRLAADALSEDPAGLAELLRKKDLKDNLFDAAAALILSWGISDRTIIERVLLGVSSRDLTKLPRLNSVFQDFWRRVPESDFSYWEKVLGERLAEERSKLVQAGAVMWLAWGVHQKMKLLEEALNHVSIRASAIQQRRSEVRGQLLDDGRRMADGVKPALASSSILHPQSAVKAARAEAREDLLLPVKDVVHIAFESADFFGKGGLKDVVRDKPPALLKHMGAAQTVIMPGHPSVFEQGKNAPKYKVENAGFTLDFPIEGRMETFEVFTANADGVRYYFIKKDGYFLNGYRSPNSPEALREYAVFSRAAVELLRKRFAEKKPDDIHLHDAHPALAAPFMRAAFPQEFQTSGIVTTIHNADPAYQQRFSPELFQYGKSLLMSMGMPEWVFGWQYLEFHGGLNLMKAGLVFSEKFTAVSPGYRRELLEDPDTGLRDIFRLRQNDFAGILNGLSGDIWNPATSKNVYVQYDSETVEDGKRQNKLPFQKETGLDQDEDAILVVAITRLADQKGPELILEEARRLLKRHPNVQFAIMGEENEYAKGFRDLMKKYPGRAYFTARFGEAFAQKVLAAGDLFLMPSKYEPCGLSQLQALRYGVVPIGHGVGGIDSTIIDPSEDAAKATGFKFYYPGLKKIKNLKQTPDFKKVMARFDKAVERAIWLKEEDAKAFNAMRVRGMGSVRDWDSFVPDYRELYSAARVNAFRLNHIPILEAARSEVRGQLPDDGRRMAEGGKIQGVGGLAADGEKPETSSSILHPPSAAKAARAEVRGAQTQDFSRETAVKAEGASSRSAVSSLPSVVSGEAARAEVHSNLVDSSITRPATEEIRRAELRTMPAVKEIDSVSVVKVTRWFRAGILPLRVVLSFSREKALAFLARLGIRQEAAVKLADHLTSEDMRLLEEVSARSLAISRDRNDKVISGGIVFMDVEELMSFAKNDSRYFVDMLTRFVGERSSERPIVTAGDAGILGRIAQVLLNKNSGLTVNKAQLLKLLDQVIKVEPLRGSQADTINGLAEVRRGGMVTILSSEEMLTGLHEGANFAFKDRLAKDNVKLVLRTLFGRMRVLASQLDGASAVDRVKLLEEFNARQVGGLKKIAGGFVFDNILELVQSFLVQEKATSKSA